MRQFAVAEAVAVKNLRTATASATASATDYEDTLPNSGRGADVLRELFA